MPTPKASLSMEDFHRTLHQSLAIKRHVDLFLWLQGDIQQFLPHDILLAAWGDFESGQIHIDVLSALASIRTSTLMERDIAPSLVRLHEKWRQYNHIPYTLSAERGFPFSDKPEHCAVNETFRAMRSAIVHGMRDHRGRNDCLYIVFSTRAEVSRDTHRFYELLLPYLDTALRCIAHLPSQYPVPVAPPIEELPPPESIGNSFGLSNRELEIMLWVRGGKTNHEIGLILDISAFTVKNHLQRIFKKMNVISRAQAVDQLSGNR